MQKINFFFDFLSPYSYFAWKNHSNQLDRGLFEYRPILMGKLFAHWDIKGPGEIAPKRYTMLKSCFRYAKKNNIDFIPPTEHPFNPLYVLRLATYECAKEQQFEVIDCLWDMIWARGEKADEPQVIETTLKNAGLEHELLMERSFSKEAKIAVKQNTKEAVAKGLFGVPSFVVDNEFFWGNDSLSDLKDYLENGDQFNQELFDSRTRDISW